MINFSYLNVLQFIEEKVIAYDITNSWRPFAAKRDMMIDNMRTRLQIKTNNLLVWNDNNSNTHFHGMHIIC